MATNKFFSAGSKRERELLEDLIIESIQIYGMDVMYIRREVLGYDTLITEEVISRFNDAWPIEMYLESVDGFEGDGDMMSRFGFMGKDTATFAVAVRRWHKEIGGRGYLPDSIKPSPGDLIYMPNADKLFEIRFVEDEVPFYQLNGLTVYKLECDMFQYNNQDLDTGYAAIDEKQTQNSAVSKLFVDDFDVNDVDPREGETMKFFAPDGSERGSCEFFRIDEDGYLVTSPLTFKSGEQEDIEPGTKFIGQITGSTLTVLAEFPFAIDNDRNAQNPAFANGAELFVDFSTSDPFGEITRN